MNSYLIYFYYNFEVKHENRETGRWCGDSPLSAHDRKYSESTMHVYPHERNILSSFKIKKIKIFLKKSEYFVFDCIMFDSFKKPSLHKIISIFHIIQASLDGSLFL